MFAFEFMRNAFVAGTIIAVVCGIIGVFVVARNMPFLTHTLSEIGFAGAAFGMFVGISPLDGMLLFTILSSVLVGRMSNSNAERREDSISAVSGLFIGLGVLFLALSNASATYATNILFGSVVGISPKEIHEMIILSVVVLVVMLLIYRDLKFDSFDPIGAASQKVPVGIVSLIFLVMLAVSVSVAAQIVGALLIFILLTLPAASAKYFAKSVGAMIFLAVVFGLIGVWAGLYLGYLTNWPVSFFIATIECSIYFVALLFYHVREA